MASGAFALGQVPAVVLLDPAGGLERLLRLGARERDDRIGRRIEQGRGRRHGIRRDDGGVRVDRVDDRGAVDRPEQRRPHLRVAELGVGRAQVEEHGGEGRARVAQEPAVGRRREVGRRRGRQAGRRVEVARRDRRRRAGRRCRRTCRSIPARYGVGRSGRPVGRAVVSESVGRADGSAVASAAGWTASAGTSSACVSSRVTTRERPGADGLPPERVVGQQVDRDLAEQVRRGDRLGRGLQEPAQRRRQRERDLERRQGLDRDLAPRRRGRALVGRVLEGLDRVDDVVGGDRLAVVPARVRAEVEGPGLAGRVDGPARGEVRHDRAVRAVAHEAGEDEGDQVAVGLGPRGQRADRGGMPDHALAIGARRRVRGAGRRGRGRGRGEGGDADEARDQREQHDQRPDHGGIGPGHETPCGSVAAGGRRGAPVRRRGRRRTRPARRGRTARAARS